jgi:hypothetical protein
VSVTRRTIHATPRVPASLHDELDDNHEGPFRTAAAHEVRLALLDAFAVEKVFQAVLEVGRKGQSEAKPLVRILQGLPESTSTNLTSLVSIPALWRPWIFNF